MTNEQRASLASQKDVANFFMPPSSEPAEPRGQDLHRRLISLAIDAYRSELISNGRMSEVLREIGMSSDTAARLLFDLDSAPLATAAG